MTREDPQLKVRLPAWLKTQVEWEATLNKRSLNAEIVHRIETTLNPTKQSPYLLKITSDLSTLAEQIELKDHLIELLVDYVTSLRADLAEMADVESEVPWELTSALLEDEKARPPSARSRARPDWK